jgi:hypothetical protein
VLVVVGSTAFFSLSPMLLPDALLVVVTSVGWFGGGVDSSTFSVPFSQVTVFEGIASSKAGDVFPALSLATNSGAAALSLGRPGTMLEVVRYLNTASSSGRTKGIESLSRSLPYSVIEFCESRRSALYILNVWLPIKMRMPLTVGLVTSCCSKPVTSNEQVMLGSCGVGLVDLEFDCVTRASAKNTGSVILGMPSIPLWMLLTR